MADLPETLAAEIWEKYENGVAHHTALDMFYQDERCHQFYAGNQWWEAQVGDKELPALNFIKPVGKYKISMIAQNNMQIVFSSISQEPGATAICEGLNRLAAKIWEKTKMDTQTWRVVKNAFITGDHFVYWHDARDQYEGSIKQNHIPDLRCRLLHRTNVFLADEQNRDLQQQEYIIISERLPVARVLREAEKNGIPLAQRELIVADTDTQRQLGEDSKAEVKSKRGKCTGLLYISKDEHGQVWFCRVVKGVVYKPRTPMPQLTHYPLVSLVWEEFVGTARGLSGVRPLIPDQVAVNRIAAWRSEAVKRFAFPKLAYDPEKIANVAALKTVGAAIEVRNMQGQSIESFLRYMNPTPISGDAAQLQNELMTLVRELEGAGDAATGAVDPTKASGEAIKAARDQAAVPLNEQMAAAKQYIEDTALVWYSLIASSPVGVELEQESGRMVVGQEELVALNPDVRIDVTPVDPYSRVSQDILLKGLMDSGTISFTEYVEAMGDESSMPKAKLKAILAARPQEPPPEETPPEEQPPPEAALLAQMEGGVTDVPML